MKSSRTVGGRFALAMEKQEFDPGFLGLLTNPAYFARKTTFENVEYFAPKITGKVLDVGCGSKPYERLFKDVEYVGIEIDTPKNRLNKNVDSFYDGKTFPFADKIFDSVISTEVLVLVFNPDEFLQEIRRVLKPDGVLLLTTPFAWNEMPPHDYARYSSFGIAHLIKKNGFEVIEQRKNVADVRLIFQFMTNYVRRTLKIKNRRLKLIAYTALCGPLNIMGSLLYRILPGDEAMYLNNIVLAKKI